MTIASEKTHHTQNPSTYRVGLVAALYSIVIATAGATTTACDGVWGGCSEGRKGYNWQEEGRCAEEHFA